VKAIVIHEPGGPDVMRWEDRPLPAAVGPGDVLVRHTAIGVNFIDVYQRLGRYPVAAYPSSIGSEGVGVVEAVGSGVKTLRAGQRVGYAMRTAGAYAEQRIVPAAMTVPLPDDVPDEVAAVLMLKGMTAEYLLHRSYAVRAGDTVLVHAAAGGMGLLLCAWAKALGARVIGTTSTSEKADVARTYGADEVILYGQDDFAARAKALTGGRGVQVVYDGVGSATFQKSLDALATLGHLVCYGASSGAVEPFDLGRLSANSLTVSRPVLFHYTADRARLEEMAARTFAAYREGKIRPEVRKRYALKEAAEAHRALESRASIGAMVLIP
jgi:NADPH2:quinone reductase